MLFSSLAGAAEDPATVIQTLLNLEKTALHRCWEKAAADDWHVEGDLVLNLSLDAKGKVKKVDVASTTIRDQALTDCLIGRAKVWTFEGLPSDIGTIQVPLKFRAPDKQYTVREEDVVPHIPSTKKVETRLLLDKQSVGAEKAALVIQSIKRNVAMPFHKHTSAEIMVVLEGSIEVLGLAGGKATKVGRGDAVYLAAGTAHSLRSTSPKQRMAKLLILYAPPGPERPFRDAAAAPGTAALTPEERAKPDPNAPQPVVAKAEKIEALPIANGKGTVKILLDKAAAGDGAAYAGWLEAQAGMTVPEHVHAAEAEILFVTAGAGEMVVAGETVPVAAGMAIYIPPNTKHSFKAAQDLTAVQFYAPSGPEQRFKGGAAPGAAKK